MRELDALLTRCLKRHFLRVHHSGRVCVHRQRASNVTELTSHVCLTNKTIKCLNLTLPRLAEKVRYP